MATTVIDNANHHTPTAGSTQVKGRRKLEFLESQRFKGKYFFLDLPGYRKTKDIAAELTSRGASVQDYLDKRVRYLITNKPQEDINRAKANLTSNPTTPSTGGLSQVFSPYSTGQSPYLDKKISPQSHYYTRSRKMLEMAKQKETQSTDILTLAARCNCKIIHVEAVVKELKKLKPLTKKKTSIEYKGPTPKYVRKLRKPFFKIEDLSLHFRPIIYETTNWPSPNFDCSARVSPFDIHHRNISDDNRESSPKKDYEEAEERLEGQDETACEDERRSGYCEPCSMRYEDLKEHLNSKNHKSYADNENNFIKLDELISQCTPLHEFLVKARRESRRSSTPDGMCSSPVAMSPMMKLPQLSLKRVASPIAPLLQATKLKRINHSSSESCDLVAKRTRLNL